MHRPFEMVLNYQPPNAHVRISGILPSNAMAAVAVKKIYTQVEKSQKARICILSLRTPWNLLCIDNTQNFW
jgi:hypothetical protein